MVGIVQAPVADLVDWLLNMTLGMMLEDDELEIDSVVPKELSSVGVLKPLLNLEMVLLKVP